jgi:hypothetical protein
MHSFNNINNVPGSEAEVDLTKKPSYSVLVLIFNAD